MLSQASQRVASKDHIIARVGLHGRDQIRLVAGVENHHVIEPAETTVIQARQFLDVWHELEFLLDLENWAFQSIQRVGVGIRQDVCKKAQIRHHTSPRHGDNDGFQGVIRRNKALVVAHRPPFESLDETLVPFGLFQQRNHLAEPLQSLNTGPCAVNEDAHLVLPGRELLAIRVVKALRPLLQNLHGARGRGGVHPELPPLGGDVGELPLHGAQVHAGAQVVPLHPGASQRQLDGGAEPQRGKPKRIEGRAAAGGVGHVALGAAVEEETWHLGVGVDLEEKEKDSSGKNDGSRFGGVRLRHLCLVMASLQMLFTILVVRLKMFPISTLGQQP